MANIVINEFCNQNCSYCFANKMMTETEQKATNMSFEEFKDIVNFIKMSNVHEIGVIGGEPTLHPRFQDFMYHLQNIRVTYPFKLKLFTNGTNIIPFLGCLMNCNILVNVNHPDEVGSVNYGKTLKGLYALDTINTVVEYGINLYPDLPDFQYILDLTEEHHKNFIRTSYVAPTKKYENMSKDEYYLNAKPLFLDFLHEAAKRNIKLELDCNNIPFCYFTDEELNFIKDHCVGRFNQFCLPVIDIKTGWKATSCFGAYHLVDLKQFNNLIEAERYFYCHEMLERTKNNNSGRCESCEKLKNLSCQGGCLAFSNWEEKI